MFVGSAFAQCRARCEAEKSLCTKKPEPATERSNQSTAQASKGSLVAQDGRSVAGPAEERARIARQQAIPWTEKYAKSYVDQKTGITLNLSHPSPPGKQGNSACTIWVQIEPTWEQIKSDQDRAALLEFYDTVYANNCVEPYKGWRRLFFRNNTNSEYGYITAERNFEMQRIATRTGLPGPLEREEQAVIDRMKPVGEFAGYSDARCDRLPQVPRSTQKPNVRDICEARARAGYPLKLESADRTAAFDSIYQYAKVECGSGTGDKAKCQLLCSRGEAKDLCPATRDAPDVYSFSRSEARWTLDREYMAAYKAEEAEIRAIEAELRAQGAEERRTQAFDEAMAKRERERRLQSCLNRFSGSIFGGVCYQRIDQ